MKALVLAAGKGTRLGALTCSRPKPMMRVAGRPLLQHIFDRLRRAGITEIFVNLHHHGEAIAEYFGDGAGSGVSLRYSYEPELLGTAGAAKKLEAALGDRFLVHYGDNFVDVDIAALVGSHARRHAVATVAVFRAADDVSASGVVEIDEDGRIRRFVEKPAPGETASRLVNAGVYVLERAALAVVPPGRFADFGRDAFPALVAADQPLYAFRFSGLVIGIDTPDTLARLDAYLRAAAPGRQGVT